MAEGLRALGPRGRHVPGGLLLDQFSFSISTPEERNGRKGREGEASSLPPNQPPTQTQAWDLYCRVFRALSSHLASLRSLHLRHVAPRLLGICGGNGGQALQLAVPGECWSWVVMAWPNGRGVSSSISSRHRHLHRRGRGAGPHHQQQPPDQRPAKPPPPPFHPRRRNHPHPRVPPAGGRPPLQAAPPEAHPPWFGWADVRFPLKGA